MLESTLWKHLKPELRAWGKFQKISDRFTPGIPDTLGCARGKGFAFEFKEFDGVRILKVSFRPGQLDWLRDWEKAGGLSWIVASHKQTVYVLDWRTGARLERGVDVDTVVELAKLRFTKSRTSHWSEFVSDLIHLEASRPTSLSRRTGAAGKS